MKKFYFLMIAALAASSIPAQAAAPSATDQPGWQLAVHSWMFQKFSLAEAIDKTAALGVKNMSISGRYNRAGGRKWSGRPFFITEWYIKGADSGLPNKTGAGWLVPTQKDRGLFYQNFCLELLQSPNCVGWQWFKYQDNDPENLNTDPSNRDSNKGIVNPVYEPYNDLLAQMKILNQQVYHLIRYFDRSSTSDSSLRAGAAGKAAGAIAVSDRQP